MHPQGRSPPAARSQTPPAAAVEADADGALVSLVVSTRDRGRHLAPFLASLDAIRSGRRWELVLVDNASSDDTWPILVRFAERAQVRPVLVREGAPGLSNARNAGVRAARGAILCFTDDDCYPQPDFVDAVAQVFESADVGFMGGRILLHDPADDPVGVTTRTAPVRFPAQTFIAPGEIQGACMAFRREVFAEVGLFHTGFGAGAPLRAAEDSEMVARAGYAGWEGGFFPQAAVRHHHRRRAAAATRITANYDYSAGALFAKLILDHPRHRSVLIRQWFWLTPVLWKPSRRSLSKFWQELQGAAHYLLRYARRAPSLACPRL